MLFASNPAMRTGLDFKSAQFGPVRGEAEDQKRMNNLFYPVLGLHQKRMNNLFYPVLGLN